MCKCLIIHLSLFFIIFSGCKPVTKENTAVSIETYSFEDLEYPEKSVEISDAIQKQFIANFFLPWNQSPEELLNSIDAFPGKQLSYLEDYLNDDEWYGENKKPHKKFLREEIVNNASTEGFPNFLRKGIVIAHTNLRRIPSNRPGFDKYSKAGEGFPFDYFQETNLWANTPLQLLHLTKDKQWCYVISPYYKGWVAMQDLAVVDEEFIHQWVIDSYTMPLFDNLSLQSDFSHYAITTKMGMVLPYEETENPEKVLVYYVNSDENQNAKLLKAEVDKRVTALGSTMLDKSSLKLLVSNLVERPYGWGGNLENRDCSSMIRDLLATYKIWLPRDSKDQIEVGQQYELTGSSEEKMELIKEKGIPFLTILRKKGHNMLYVGNNDNDEPLIFHAIWGLKTTYTNEQLAEYLKNYPIEGIHQEEDGSLKGRHVIGEAVITSVMAGEGNNQVTIPLLEEIYAMTNILENETFKTALKK